MGLPHISQASFHQGLPPPPPRGPAPWGSGICGSGTSLPFLVPSFVSALGSPQKEDTTSSISSGSLGGDPSSLCCLYTSRYRDWISSLLVWGPTSWMADMSASGSSFGNSCQQPWQTISLCLLPPLVCSMSEHLI